MKNITRMFNIIVIVAIMGIVFVPQTQVFAQTNNTNSAVPFHKPDWMSNAEYEEDLRRWRRLEDSEHRVRTQRRYAGMRHELIPDIQRQKDEILIKYRQHPPRGQ